ncbi:MAG: hypothetical protein MRERC_2c109 [Mycoplasmataceae bacterium RC_NB112A]|nr:MAG: hypothetical protein MRERC_2c109 [Mycoplasmataceae bacterium RC_NB112A]
MLGYWTKKPSTRELKEIIEKIKCQEIKQKYNTFSQNTPYQIHPTATTTSKMIDTNEITRRLNELGLSEKVNIQNSKEIFFKDSEEIALIEIRKNSHKIVLLLPIIELIFTLSLPKN